MIDLRLLLFFILVTSQFRSSYATPTGYHSSSVAHQNSNTNEISHHDIIRRRSPLDLDDIRPNGSRYQVHTVAIRAKSRRRRLKARANDEEDDNAGESSGIGGQQHRVGSASGLVAGTQEYGPKTEHVKMTNYKNEFFSVEVQVGDPNKSPPPLRLAVDTGSPNVLVLCTKTFGRDKLRDTRKHTLYKLTDEKEQSAVERQIKFGGRPPEDVWATKDAVKIGQLTSVSDQTIGCFQFPGTHIDDRPTQDGVFGLATSGSTTLKLGASGNEARGSTWIENAYRQGKIDKPVFTVDMYHSKDDSTDTKSYLTLGMCLCRTQKQHSIDLDMFDGQWSFQARTTYLDDQSRYLLDTGAPFMVLSKQEIEDYKKKKSSIIEDSTAGSESISLYAPCDSGDKLPDLDLHLILNDARGREKQYAFTIPGKYMMSEFRHPTLASYCKIALTRRLRADETPQRTAAAVAHSDYTSTEYSGSSATVEMKTPSRPHRRRAVDNEAPRTQRVFDIRTYRIIGTPFFMAYTGCFKFPEPAEAEGSAGAVQKPKPGGVSTSPPASDQAGGSKSSGVSKTAGGGIRRRAPGKDKGRQQPENTPSSSDASIASSSAAGVDQDGTKPAVVKSKGRFIYCDKGEIVTPETPSTPGTKAQTKKTGGTEIGSARGPTGSGNTPQAPVPPGTAAQPKRVEQMQNIDPGAARPGRRPPSEDGGGCGPNCDCSDCMGSNCCTGSD